MNILKELQEDTIYIKECLFDGANKEYKFSGKYGPVIGIHGVFGGWTKDSLRKFMTQNQVEGKLIYWGSLTDALEDYFPKLETEMKKYNKPTLIGFSSGGLLAILYIERFKLWDKINKIITVATPFSGNPAYAQHFGKSIKDTLPESDIIKEIVNLNPPKDKVLSIFAKEDKFTHHPERIKLNWPSIVLPAQGHGDLQNHYEWINDILKKELNII